MMMTRGGLQRWCLTYPAQEHSKTPECVTCKTTTTLCAYNSASSFMKSLPCFDHSFAPARLINVKGTSSYCVKDVSPEASICRTWGISRVKAQRRLPGAAQLMKTRHAEVAQAFEGRHVQLVSYHRAVSALQCITEMRQLLPRHDFSRC